MIPANMKNMSSEVVDSRLLSHTDQSRELHLSARRLMVFVFMLLIFTLAARPIMDPDFWWHLKTGQYLVQTHALPHADIFSAFFSGKEWIAHEWLSEIFMYLVYQVAGFGGLIVVFALIISAAFAILYRLAAERVGHVYVSGAAMLLGAAAAAPTLGVRPQMFSFLLASIFLAVLDRFQKNEETRSIWWLVPLMALWVNLHAGFAIGIALILLVIIGTIIEAVMIKRDTLPTMCPRVRRLSMVLLASVVAVWLHPN